MQRTYGINPGFLCLATMVMAALIPSASASVVGKLDFANCGSGGVTVSPSTIDFLLPIGGGNGCILAGAGTAITSSSGTITPGASGTVNDLGFGAPGAGFAGFITFGGIQFNLTAAGPGPGIPNTVCATALNGSLPACSVFAGSPFVLTPNASGTAVALPVSGFASDSTSSNSTFLGAFTTQLAGLTPAGVQSTILAGGSITSTYSFDGVAAAAVPEPVTMLLIGGALIGLAGLKRRKVGTV